MVTYNTGISVRFLEEALETVLASNNTLGYTDKVYANVTYLHTLVDTVSKHWGYVDLDLSTTLFLDGQTNINQGCTQTLSQNFRKLSDRYLINLQELL